MELYVGGYENTFMRFLRSFFVQMPLTLWFRFITAYWPSSTAFINYTSVSDAVLAQQWALAQHSLATAPFPQNYSGGNMHAADPRALTVQPEHVTVVSVPDVPIADLVKIDPAWAKDKDPSGAIIFTGGNGLLGYTPCHAFSLCYKKPRVYAAASEIPNVLSYEFQNLILSRLGYDVSAR
jgi:hypothetical protein